MGDQYDGGVLTTTQRKYLRGESDIQSPSAHERATRARIRNRIRKCLLDFPLLRRRLEARDRQKVFHPPSDDERVTGNLLIGVAPEVIAFLYLGLTDYQEDDKAVERAFSSLVSKGVTTALVHQGISVKNVEVSIEVEHGEALSDLETTDLDEQSTDILQQLLIAGKITPEEFAEVINARKKNTK